MQRSVLAALALMFAATGVQGGGHTAAGHPAAASPMHASAPVIHSVPARPVGVLHPIGAPHPVTAPARPWRGAFIANPYRWRPWAWNRGVRWYPAPCYWGGGFWGEWGLLAAPAASCYWGGSYWGPWGLYASAPVPFGSVPDYDAREIYPSYEAAPQSPGAELLQDYGLQQTDCGPPNLVVIWGPDKSVICAFPSDLVAPGNYVLDPDTLTLHSL
jgi:hypothetical protein